MHASSLLTLVLAAVASGAAVKNTKRECYRSGQNFGQNQVLALNYATQACQDAFVGLDDQASYKKGDSFQQCYNLDSRTKVDFSLIVYDVGSDGFNHLSQSRCADGLRAEVQGCDQGGSSDKDGITFK